MTKTAHIQFLAALYNSIDNVSLISNGLSEIDNSIEDNIVPANRNNQNIDLHHQVFNFVEQSPHPNQAIGNYNTMTSNNT